MNLRVILLCLFVGAAGQAAAEEAREHTPEEAALNALREENEQPPLIFSEILETAALRHARDMAQKDFFSHTGSDGSDVADRVRRAGYNWCTVAENIAQGQMDLEEVMEDWANSPGHLRNMLSADVTEFALVEGDNAIWVMVLAAPGC